MIGRRAVAPSGRSFSMEGQTSVPNFIKAKRMSGEERVVRKLKGKADNPYALKNWMKKKRPEAYRKMARKGR